MKESFLFYIPKKWNEIEKWKMKNEKMKETEMKSGAAFVCVCVCVCVCICDNWKCVNEKLWK